MSNDDQLVQNKRLHILYEDYIVNPLKVIKSFIGIDADIIDYKMNSIIGDGYVVVDVQYKSLDLNPTKIYWTQFKDCKKINVKRDNTFITKVNNCNVCLNIGDGYMNNDWIPFTVSQFLTTSRENNIFKYYGTIVYTPYHFGSTEVFIYNHEEEIDYMKCNKETPPKVDPAKLIDKSSEIINNFDNNVVSLATSKTAKTYTFEETNDPNTTLKQINNSNVKNSANAPTTIYTFDIRKLTETDMIRGVIYCSQSRTKPWECCYYKNSNAKITNKKIQYLKQFMYNDYKNYLEWLEHIK